MKMRSIFLVLIVGVSLRVPALNAQAEGVTNAVSLASALRSGRHPSGISETLRQKFGKVPTATLDAIADSIVVFVISTKTPESYDLRSAALFDLESSSRAKTGETPYAGAIERLGRIAIEASSNSDRTAAIGALGRAADHSQAIRVLREIALSQKSEAYLAVQALCVNQRQFGGEAVAKQIWSAGGIPNARARQALDEFSRLQKWKK